MAEPPGDYHCRQSCVDSARIVGVCLMAGIVLVVIAALLQ